MDPLTSLLDGLRLRAKLFYVGGVCGRWAVDHNSDTAIWFHLVTKGNGWIHSPVWQQPLEVGTGDLILFLPHAEKHYLSYSPHEVTFDDPDARMTAWEEGSTGFVCGLIGLELPKSAIWQALPAEIVIRKNDAGEGLAQLIQLILTESCAMRFGQRLLIEHLCDGMFVLVVRHCIERGLTRPGVFAAMQDNRLERVLELIHKEPWQPWTIGALCTYAGLSKTMLTQRFVELMGCPPMQYLTLWRMQRAAGWLRESGMTIERVAERCGYDSVPAFSRAFKRCFGATPGVYRRTTEVPEHTITPRVPGAAQSALAEMP